MVHDYKKKKIPGIIKANESEKSQSILQSGVDEQIEKVDVSTHL